MTDIHHDDIRARWRDLAALAIGIEPTKLDPFEPTHGEVMEVVEDIKLLARRVDTLIEAYAAYVEYHSGYSIARDCKFDQLAKQLDGNLFHEIECAANDVRDRLMEGVMTAERAVLEMVVASVPIFMGAAGLVMCAGILLGWL